MPITPSVRRWLAARDADPSIRYRYLMEIEGRSARDPAVRREKARIGRQGWAAQLLDAQFPDGHWATSSRQRDWFGRPEIYVPKYTATNWVAIVLGELGMDRSNPRIRKTAELIVQAWGGPRSSLGGAESETCVTGNALRTLIAFGYLDHPEVQRSIRWILKAQKRDGGWHCWRSRGGTLDAWEGLAGLAAIPEDRRAPEVTDAIDRGVEFFLDRRLYREGPKYAPWFRIHYPNHYYYDLLVGLRLMTRLGRAKDRRLGPALDWLESRRQPDGRWPLDAAHPDLDPKVDYQMSRVHYSMILEAPGRPSRWATLEALRVLKASGRL